MAITYQTDLYAPTLKEVSQEAIIPSHQLLLRAGYVRKLASGLYTYLPLATKVLANIESIVRQVLDAHKAQEVLLPILGPSELWEESGRYSAYGPELMRIQDRHDRQFVLGPTHEEIMCDLVRGELTSYKQLPVNLYQIQDKFRDELRPRFGLMRGREFIMKDGYSFDADVSGMQKSYDNMFAAYSELFSRMGLKTLPVAADSGQIGGSTSIEFMAIAEEGEAEVLWCDCGYAADVEAATAEVSNAPKTSAQDASPAKRVHTPGASSIEDVSALLNVDQSCLLKAIALTTEPDGPVVIFVPGDHDVNEVKLNNAFGTWHFMTKEELDSAGLIEGFIGPIGLDATKVKVYKDASVKAAGPWSVGANEQDYHVTGAIEGRDFTEFKTIDVISAQAGDLCPNCGQPLHMSRGIEVGQIFQLGDKYSKPMDATYLDAQQKEQFFQMGCYGIGITRTLQALVAEFHDEAGICWPIAVAPFAVHIILLDPNDHEMCTFANELAKDLASQNFDVLIDNREVRPGPKFKDADLFGMPLSVTLGKRGFEQGVAEVKVRSTQEKVEVPLANLARTCKEKLAQMRN